MMKRHPVVIFDNFAWQGLQRLGLKPGDSTYREYFDLWFRFFEQEDTKDGLDDALEWLRNSPYTQSLLEEGYIRASELDSLWFRNRVTDVRLWLPRRSRLVGRVEVKGQQWSPLRPVLRTVGNTRNLNRVLLDLIDNYVRQRCECEFAPSGHAAAGWSKMGKITQAGAPVIDRSSNAEGSLGVVTFDPFANAL
jgi:hypothetical protein